MERSTIRSATVVVESFPYGLRRRPNQKDYTLRLQQYFDYELRDAAKPDWMTRGIPYLEKPGVVVGPEVEQ